MFFHGLEKGGVFSFLRWSNNFQTIAELLIDTADANYRAARSSTKLWGVGALWYLLPFPLEKFLLNSQQQKSKQLLSVCYFLQVHPYSSITKTCTFLDNFADIIIGIYLELRDEAKDIATNERQLRVIASGYWEIKNITTFLSILLWEILIFSIGKMWLKFQI